MVEEQGVVIKVEKDFAWVKMQRKSSCGHCSMKQGCGTGSIAQVFGEKQIEIKAINQSNVEVGDTVIIGLEEGALLRGSFTLYLIPLLCMFAAAIFYEVLAERAFLPNSEILVAIAGIAGLGGGLAWIKRISEKMAQDKRYHPVVLKVVY